MAGCRGWGLPSWDLGGLPSKAESVKRNRAPLGHQAPLWDRPWSSWDVDPLLDGWAGPWGGTSALSHRSCLWSLNVTVGIIPHPGPASGSNDFFSSLSHCTNRDSFTFSNSHCPGLCSFMFSDGSLLCLPGHCVHPVTAADQKDCFETCS